MRQRAALALAVWIVAACAPAPAAAPPAPSVRSAAAAAADGETDRGLLHQGPDASAHGGSAARPIGEPRPAAPAGKESAPVLMPAVRAVASRPAFAPFPSHPATAAELAALAPTVSTWVATLARGLDGVRYPVAGVDRPQALRALTSESRVAHVLERWTDLNWTETTPRTFVAGGARILGGLDRAWGSTAYVDAAVDLVDRGATEIPIHATLRLRPTGFSFTIIDLYDPAGGRWLVGDAPRYAAVDLEAELPSAVAQYLASESLTSGREAFSGMIATDTPFGRVRNAAIIALNVRRAAGALSDRRFADVEASVGRFEPAWFGGDGVVTVTVRGTLVETTPGGVRRVAFVQPLKFFRTPEGAWMAIDAQEADGSWASGGDLALAEVARPHG